MVHVYMVKAWGYCYRLRPCICPSIMLSLPKPLDEIQPNLVCELLTWMGRATAFVFLPRPLGLLGGSKGQILFNFNYKVNFKDFHTKLCVCSHKWKIQNISDRISILSPGSWRGFVKFNFGMSRSFSENAHNSETTCILWSNFTYLYIVTLSRHWYAKRFLIFTD